MKLVLENYTTIENLEREVANLAYQLDCGRMHRCSLQHCHQPAVHKTLLGFISI